MRPRIRPSRRSASRARRSARSSARRWWRASGQPATGWTAADVGLGHRQGAASGPAAAPVRSSRRSAEAGGGRGRTRPGAGSRCCWARRAPAGSTWATARGGAGKSPGPRDSTRRSGVTARSRRSPPRRRVVDSTATRPPDWPPGHDEDVARAHLLQGGQSPPRSSIGAGGPLPRSPGAGPVLLDVAPLAAGPARASARAARVRSSWASRRTTSLSARYWANDRLSRWWATSGG